MLYIYIWLTRFPSSYRRCCKLVFHKIFFYCTPVPSTEPCCLIVLCLGTWPFFAGTKAPYRVTRPQSGPDARWSLRGSRTCRHRSIWFDWMISIPYPGRAIPWIDGRNRVFAALQRRRRSRGIQFHVRPWSAAVERFVLVFCSTLDLKSLKLSKSILKAGRGRRRKNASKVSTI